MLDKTKTRISDLLKKSVGLPGSESSCCNPVARGLVETESRVGADEGSCPDASRAKSSCCGSGAESENADRGRGDRS
jgi:hypothetical protein